MRHWATGLAIALAIALRSRRRAQAVTFRFADQVTIEAIGSWIMRGAAA
jgi:hypothetical protein